MSKNIIFDGKRINRPGAYSRLKSGIRNPPVDLDFGGLTIVDDGTLTSGWSGGSGIDGTFKQNKDSVYTFTDISDFKEFIGGGMLHLLADAFFFPAGRGSGINGVSYIEYIRSATTVPAEMTFNPTGGGSNGGNLVIQTVDEGLRGNGIEGDEIRAGFVFSVDTAGSAGDTIDFQVNEGAGLTSKGNYTALTGDTTNDVASGIAAAITAAGSPYGYSASNDGATVTVLAPINSGDTPNGYSVSVIVTGGITVTAPSAFGTIAQVKNVTLTGTSGSANITVDGIDYLAEFDSDTATTAGNFVSSHSAALTDAGITVADEGLGVLSFTANVAGVPFSISVTNVTPDLDGTIADIAINGIGPDGVDGSKLTQGYSYVMEVSPADSSKYVLSFYRGTFTGLDENGVPFDKISIDNAEPELVIQSVEFDNVNDLISWMNSNYDFSLYFKLKSGYTVNGSGTVNAADLSTFASNQLASGGTETYSSTNFDNALDLLKNSKSSFVFATKGGSDYAHANNLKLEQFVSEDANFNKQLYVAGGSDESEFESISITAANLFDNQYVTPVHGGSKKIKSSGGFYEYNSLYKAALLLGREAGLEPQIPLTFKSIDIDGEVHNLTEKQITRAIDQGLLCTSYDDEFEYFAILRGFNSLQDNENLLNENGTTASKQLLRIALQVNKELVINAKKTLLSQENGVNRNTLSEEDVAGFTETYLNGKIATAADDDLIISFQNINVQTVGTTYRITYEIVPNFEVEFLLFTGTIIDPNA